MAEPNLFAHARGELTQDAFLCWLLEWADPSCRAIDPETQAASRAFLALLYGLHGHMPPDDVPMKVAGQVEHADVVAMVGDHDLLVIEDKTGTTQHSDQLSRYRKAFAEAHPGRRFIGVYLTTGDESSYAHASSGDWRVCTRAQLLSVLPVGARNVILRDFQLHIAGIERAVESYRTASLADWTKPAWRGAFMALQTQLPGSHWRYVANPSGGFMGFWMPERQLGERRVKVQLEDGRLVIKLIGKPATERRRVSDHILARFPPELQMRKPARFGSGNFVTVAESALDWRQLAEDGRFDLEATHRWLARADAALAEIGPVP